jgi:glycosyltransferase involved in cell wall biosynthesis
MVRNKLSNDNKAAPNDYRADSGRREAPSAFFSMPSFSALKLFFMQDGQIVRNMMPRENEAQERRILWFTDTLNDLNGPSVTLKKLGWLAHKRGMNLHLVSSLLPDEITPEIPPNVINLPHILSFKLPYYDKYTIKVPAFLKSLRIIKEYKPTEIYISTPGPIGLFAMWAANILKVRKIAIYHTDFYLQSKAVVSNSFLPPIIERAVHWFYGSMDDVRVPTYEYMDILENRGYDRSRMHIFRRGIDAKFFSMRERGKTMLMEKFNIRDGITLIFTGRISKDKNLDFLLEVYRELLRRHESINLLLVGDGPDLPEMKERMKAYPRVVFTGKLSQAVLPEVYSGSDVFVFPSIADTFGMSVLESQACGLPGVVSDSGGPKEIIIPGSTGLVARSSDRGDWIEKLEYMIRLITSDYEAYLDMKEKSRNNAVENYDWDSVLNELMGTDEAFEAKKSHIA